jgi:hypothetical protein
MFMKNIINFPKKHIIEEHQNTLTHHQKLATFGYQVTMGLGTFALTMMLPVLCIHALFGFSVAWFSQSAILPCACYSLAFLCKRHISKLEALT